MTQNKNIKISISVTDFPVFKSLNHAFKEAKKSGADGIELFHGIKSHWPFKNIKKLSKEYNLPILSIHQPLWSGLGIPDFSFIKNAKELGVKHITIHPLPRVSLESQKMKKYFENLKHLQKKHNLCFFLENLPVKKQAAFVDKYFPGHKDSLDPLKILKVAKKYGFKLTLDTTHLEDKDLAKKPWLKNVLLHTGNIHFSNFTKDKAHLPIHIGDMNYLKFLKALRKYNYKGLITLEVYYPKIITFRRYDYKEIKKSIEIIRKELKL